MLMNRLEATAGFCWFIIFVLGLFHVNNAVPSNATHIYVQLDSTLELRCNFGGEGNKLVMWKIDNLTAAIGPIVLSPDRRIQVLDKEGLLKLRSIREDDEGMYVCHLGVDSSDGHQYSVKVEEPENICTPLMDIQNGQVFYFPPLEDGRILNGTIAYYECDEGHVLVGTNGTVCDADIPGWTDLQPYCLNETLYTESLNPRVAWGMRVKKLGHDVDNLSKKQDKMQRKMINEISDLRSNVTTVSDVSQTVTRAVESVVERLLNRHVARTKLVDGRFVNEFVWHVPEIEKELEPNKSTRHLLSPRFYARLPGYSMQMRVYPNNRPGYLGLYVGLVPGEFDEEMPWPFADHFELAVISQNKKVSDIVRSYWPVLHKGCSNETFEKPKDDDLQACGFQDMMSHKRLKDNPHYYVKDGDLVVRFRLL